MPIRFVDRRGYVGQVAVPVDGANGLLLGTHVRPAGRTGVILAQADGVTSSIPGTYTTGANRTGSIITSLAGTTGLLTGAFGGVLIDGATVTVQGPAATLPPVRESLLGVNGVINTGTVGAEFLRPNWSKLGPGSRWFYSNARTLKRPKTLVFDSTINLHYAGTQFYDHGPAGITDNYESVDYYCETPDAVANFQWKVKRGMPLLDHDGGFTPDVTDGINPSWITSRYKSSDTSWCTFYNEDPPISAGPYFTPDQKWPMNAAFRMETWWSRNNPVSAANGRWRMKCTRLDTGATVVDFQRTNIVLRGPAAIVPHRLSCFQNYCGNADDFGFPRAWGDTKIFMGDIYNASHPSAVDGSAQVRAELCNNAIYANASKRAQCNVNSIVGTDWSVELNGPFEYFGTADLRGLYLALFPASGVPTMRAI